MKKNKTYNSENKKDICTRRKKERKKSRAESGPRVFKMISIILGFLIFRFSNYKVDFTSLFNYKLSIVWIIEACLKWKDCLDKMLL